MTSSDAHSGSNGAATIDMWQPVPVPRRGCHDDERVAFLAYMLAPGFTSVFHAHTLQRSLTSITNYRRAARKRAQGDPSMRAAAEALVNGIQPEHGLAMARSRGRTQLPYWSRLAIGEFRKRGLTRRELASAFNCSRATIANVLKRHSRGFNALSGARILTSCQEAPPGMWHVSGAAPARSRP